ncbi:TROVE domain-containing protein [Nocardia sp. NPDC088792]|uniref:TROVE domain-containing protein n=1 Tax=Nocardia sp. NPDC088792 TaxID=3364332 RepID=UPI0037FFCF65
MAKFNTATARAVAHGPIRTDTTATGRTHQGAPGFARDAQSELFLLAVTNMVGEKTFYETADQRDTRFEALVREVALTDLDWLTRFARWLRLEANMRSASLMLAAEAAKASVDAGQTGSRTIIDAVLQRADEPGEMLSYWMSHYGKKIPKPVKRGVADAAARLYNEKSYLKWDSDARGVRFADVIQLAHVQPKGPWQSALFRYAIEDRLGIDGLEIPTALSTLAANADLRKLSGSDIDRMAADGELAAALAESGATWEQLSSFGAWSAKRWESVIPFMGLMALTRNLRNFDQAGVSDAVATAKVAVRLMDPEEVAKSRQLPMRFLSAYRAAPSLRWAYPLERALEASVSNIPELAGRTLILVDTSGSMDAGFSKDGTLMRWDAATMFGLALARRCAHADLVSYSDAFRGTAHGPRGYGYYDIPASRAFPVVAGESLLKSLERWKSGGYFLGGGTDTGGAARTHFKGHDRVVILTDEQAGGGNADPGSVIPKSVPLYTWNLAGYRMGHAAGGPNRHTFGGLSDAAFSMIPLLERGRDADWPF